MVNACRSANFNPRSREGSDGCVCGVVAIVTDFNPRSREGSDRGGENCPLLFCNFNPRSREGSDAGVFMFIPTIVISIHAPAKGATRKHQKTAQSFLHFNPRSREGSDDFIRAIVTRFALFQSTLPRRERPHLLTSFRLQYGYFLFHLTNKI